MSNRVQVYWYEEVHPFVIENGVRRLGFTGSREGMTPKQHYMVKELLWGVWVGEAHHGDCVGADAEFQAICEEHYYRPKIVIHPPDKENLRAFCRGDVIISPRPYHVRNRAIVDNCDELYAAPNSLYEEPFGGTWYTVHYAREKGKDVAIIYPDGVVYFDVSWRRLKEGDLNVNTGEIIPRQIVDGIKEFTRESVRLSGFAHEPDFEGEMRKAREKKTTKVELL